MSMNVTENEKKLLQAKHRLEEGQMRDRQKERKARTRRLIQEDVYKRKPQTLLMRPYGRERRSHHAKEIQHAPPQPRCENPAGRR